MNLLLKDFKFTPTSIPNLTEVKSDIEHFNFYSRLIEILENKGINDESILYFVLGFGLQIEP